MRPSPRPPVDPDLAGLFASRGRLDAHRYLQTRDRHNLEDAISHMRTAVTLAKETQSAVLGPALGNLAALSLEQFKSTGKDAGLNEARQLAIWALEYLSDGDADRALIFATLGNILTSQYDRSRRPQDLEEAISSLRIATQARSLLDDSMFPAVVSNNLACVLGKRYEITGRREDLNDAVTNALEATKVGLSNHPSLMAGVGLTLAGLLLRQYKSTGRLDSLANAVFELRIVIETAPEFPELDTLLSQLGSLAMEQHALRAQTTDERIKVSQSLSPKSLNLSLLLSLSTVFSVFFPRAFYPLVVFFGGIVSSWAFQECYQRITNRDKPTYFLHLIPTWIQEIFCSPYDPTCFAPTLFPTPWIDTPPTLILSKSEEERYNEEILRKQKSIDATRLESGYDPGRRNGARDGSPAHRIFSTTKCYTNGLESQSQLFYDHLADSKIWDDVNDFPSDSEPLGAPLSASEEEENVNQIDETKEYEPSILATRISTTENLDNTDVTYPKNPTEAWEKQETTSDIVPVSVGHPSKAELITEISPHAVQDEASKKQYKPPSTELSPSEAELEALKIPNQPHPSHRDIQPTEDARSTLGKVFIDHKVHSRMSTTKLDKNSSAFDSVAQGNTSNDINKNEGNAMGNIYSEEAHVVGHLSRHYGDKFETKNISAVLPYYQKPDANQYLPDATLDKLHTEGVPQELTQVTRESRSEVTIGLAQPLRELRMDADTLKHKGEQDKSRRSKRKQEAKKELGAVKTNRGQDIHSKDYISNGRSAEPKTKRATKRSDKFDAQTLSEMSDDFYHLPANASIYGYFSSNVQKKHLDHERGQGTPRIPRLKDRERSRNAWEDDSSDETSSEYEAKSFSSARAVNGASRNTAIASTQPKAETVSMRGGIFMPPSAPNLKNIGTSEQIRALSMYFNSTLLPLCNGYIQNTPADEKRREWGYRKLSEAIKSQVLLHADGIEVSDEATRYMRRKLVEDAQTTLNKLDDTVTYHE